MSARGSVVGEEYNSKSWGTINLVLGALASSIAQGGVGEAYKIIHLMLVTVGIVGGH